MSSKKKKSIDLIDHFGDDFEVSYEDETPLTYTLNPKPQRKKNSKKNCPDVMNVSSDTIYAPQARQHRNKPRVDEIYEGKPYDDEDYYDEEYNEEYDNEYDSSYSVTKKRRHKKKTPIAAPIKQSTKTAYRLIHTLLRNLSLALILAIIVYMAVNFIKGSVPYGDLEEELRTQDFSYKLVGYFAVAASLIFYEILAALWTMSKARVRDQYGRHKEDVGRGLFSFLFIYLCSYASFLVSSHIPEIHDAVLGVQGALTVFGSMHNVLFGICTAGVISCLLRKYHLN